MKESTAVGAADFASAGARQRSQVSREKWEESWITEQRAVTAVIAGEARKPSARMDAAVAQFVPNGQADASAFTTSSQEPAPAASFVEANASAHVERETNLRASSAKIYSTAIGAALVQAPVKERALASDVQQVSTRSASVPRQPSKSFAFWRDGQSLDVAMRLQDPERTSASVIAQLRQWLRGTGSKLRSVVINGRVAWNDQEPTSPSPPPQPSPARSAQGRGPEMHATGKRIADSYSLPCAPRAGEGWGGGRPAH